MRARRHAIRALLLVAVVALSGRHAAGQAVVYDEASVKAAFIYHFSTFVQWPESAPSGSEFVIAVMGSDEVAEELEAYLPGHHIGGRPMRVTHLDEISALEQAAVLYIGPDYRGELDGVLEAVSTQPVLVITDDADGLEKGAMINFKIVDRRVRFEISLNAAERAGLSLSSRLLNAAMFVDTTGKILELDADGIAAQNAAGPAF